MKINYSDLDHRPEILAPAGDKDAFLAALAAGADAVYCGLKRFSARATATNFDVSEMGALTDLAHRQESAVYVTLNTLIKPDELADCRQMIHAIAHEVLADGIIFQDPAMIELARQVGFKGELHLSTIGNVSFPKALDTLQNLDRVTRVVVPRELTVDEIKTMAAHCPEKIALEVFVHGALCYAVSGRCYWSSFLGGKSSLRGRCVQPCRRIYRQKETQNRFFSATDLSLDVLVKVIKPINKIAAWKIEGRKKGAHYVYYTATAYKMLRDEGHDPKIRKDAQALLEQALGRPGTHYNFLSHRRYNPLDTDRQTGSGLRISTIHSGGKAPSFKPRQPLYPGDRIRIGYEDQKGHLTIKIKRGIPKGGTFKVPSRNKLEKGTPVFLIDRMEKALEKKIKVLERSIKTMKPHKIAATKPVKLPRPAKAASKTTQATVYRHLPSKLPAGLEYGLWINGGPQKSLPKKLFRKTWFWLPPVIWPESENKIVEQVTTLLDKGARQFVLNALWQNSFFRGVKGCRLWAGPFCNITNPLAIGQAVQMGLMGATVSPELGQAHLLALPGQSPLPLAIVIKGNWPLGLSRILSEDIQPNRPFVSPKGETAWVAQYGDTFWVYPNWPLDLTAQAKTLTKAGYQKLIALHEPLPKGIQIRKRPGKWNWDHDLP